jgi:peptide/nickel transport system permease protein
MARTIAEDLGAAAGGLPGARPGAVPRAARGQLPARLAAGVLAAGCAVALLAPLIAPHDPASQDLAAALSPPAWTARGRPDHLLGTDFLGRDVLARLVYGARISIGIGLATAVASAVIGGLAGLTAGYLGRAVDKVLMRLVDIQLSIPRILLAIAIVALIGPGVGNVTAVLVLTGWPVFSRVVRGEVLSLKEQEFILAARALGCPVGVILARHLLPNVLGSIIVLASFAFARAIIAESALSFLGIGIQPTTPTWGGMLAEGQLYMMAAPWLAAFPGLVLMLVVLAANILGDWLRDRFDPTLRRT